MTIQGLLQARLDHIRANYAADDHTINTYANGGTVSTAESMNEQQYPHLSGEQCARVEALQAVNTYIRTTRFMGGDAGDPFALMRLATFVLIGDDLSFGGEI